MIYDTGEIYEQYRGVIINEVKRFLWNGIDFEELMQIAYFAVDKAVRYFDESKGNSFATYLIMCLRRNLLREIDKSSAIKKPEHMSCKVRAYLAAKVKLRRVLSREPDYNELADELQCSVKDVKKIEMHDIFIETSLEAIYEASGDRSELFLVEEKGFLEIEKEQFWEMVKKCVDAECYLVLELVYKTNLTCKEAAKKLGLSYTTANKMLNKAMLKLKRNEKFKKLYSTD